MSGCFDFLKETLTTVTVSAYADTSKPCILYTDASNNCIGACLYQEQDTKGGDEIKAQNEKPIHYLYINKQLHRQTGLQVNKKGFCYLLCST